MYIFAIITAGNCGWCNAFKKNGFFDRLTAEVNKMKNVKPVDVFTPDMRNPVQTYHPDLFNVYCNWFPSFGLFTEESWNDKKSRLVGKMFSGAVGPRGIWGPLREKDPGYQILKHDNIIAFAGGTIIITNTSWSFSPRSGNFKFGDFKSGPEKPGAKINKKRYKYSSKLIE